MKQPANVYLVVKVLYIKGSDTGYSLVGPTKVKAHKSFSLTEKLSYIENKEPLLDFDD